MNNKNILDDQELLNYLNTQIVPQYEAFDKAHNLTHVKEVMEESLQLALLYKADSRMCATIAAFHDLGLKIDRPMHHIHSKTILLEDNQLSRWFTPEELLVMADAVEDHRASAQKPPRSLYGKIVADADKNLDPIYTIRRAVQYGIAHHPGESKEWQYERVKEHMNEKYAEGGYLKLYLPQSSNAEKLSELRQIIADEKRLKETFDQLYEEENIGQEESK